MPCMTMSPGFMPGLQAPSHLAVMGHLHAGRAMYWRAVGGLDVAAVVAAEVAAEFGMGGGGRAFELAAYRVEMTLLPEREISFSSSACASSCRPARSACRSFSSTHCCIVCAIGIGPPIMLVVISRRPDFQAGPSAAVAGGSPAAVGQQIRASGAHGGPVGTYPCSIDQERVLLQIRGVAAERSGSGEEAVGSCHPAMQHRCCARNKATV